MTSRATQTLLLLAAPLLMAGCASNKPLDPEQKQQTQQELQQASEQGLADLIEHHPQAQQQVDDAVGYMVVELSSTKVPLVGVTKGIGTIQDNRDSSITYVDVKSEDIGIGLGHSKQQAVALFEDEESLEVFRKGINSSQVQTEWNFSEGSVSSYDVSIGEHSIPVYTVSSEGTKASLSANFVEVSKNHQLTDTGVSNTPTPTRNDPKENEPIHWDRALPFYGQNVVDMGHALPLPIGISLIYANNTQNMEIYDLKVKNSNGEMTSVNFVDFSDNASDTQTPQLKIDAWLFPFMNIFGTVGKIDGDATVSFAFDGDDLLEQVGEDCDRMNRQCRKWQGTYTDPFTVDVNMEGWSYTAGTVLATGWNDYFVSIPMSFTFLDIDRRKTHGTVINISPRVGKVHQLPGQQSLAWYVGANYMDNEVTITGTQALGEVDIEYQVTQRTEDPWEPLIGANYNLDNHWSAFLEWTGHDGGRQQWVAGLNHRF